MRMRMSSQLAGEQLPSQNIFSMDKFEKSQNENENEISKLGLFNVKS